MLYGTLPWPAWRADLAPDYTIFMPPTNRSSTVYQNQVPARPNTVTPPNEGGNPQESTDNPTQSAPGVEMTNIDRSRSNQIGDVIPSDASNSSSLPLSIFSSFFTRNYQSIAPSLDRSSLSNISTSVNRNEYASVSTESTHGESEGSGRTYNV